MKQLRSPYYLAYPIALSAILALGAWLRLRFLGARSLWFNEADSAYFLSLPISEVVRRSMDPRATSPPLFYLVLNVWASLVGESEFLLRLPAVAGGLATILGVAALVAELGAPTSAGRSPTPLLAAAFVAMNPLQIQLSQQVRGYALAIACLTWAGWAIATALRVRERLSGALWIVASFLGVAACYIHYVALLSFVALGIFAIQEWWRGVHDVPRRSMHIGREVAYILAAFGIFFVGYVLPWMPRMWSQGLTLRQDVASAINPDQVCQEVAASLFSTFDESQSIDVWFPRLAAVALAISLAISGFRGERTGRFLVITGILPPLLLAAFSLTSQRSIFLARYLCFAQVSWLIGLAAWAGHPRRGVERVIVGAGILGLMTFACYSSSKSIGNSAQPGMRGAMSHILNSRAASEPIVSRSPFMFYGAAHYARLRGERVRLCVRQPGRDNQRGAEHLRDEDLVTPTELARVDSPGIWLLSSGSYQPDLVAQFAPPKHWVLGGRWEFLQDYHFEEPLIVEHYTISQPEGP